jgi:hypothetical protein
MAYLRPFGSCKWLFINYFKLESSLFLGGFFFACPSLSFNSSISLLNFNTFIFILHRNIQIHFISKFS